MFFLLFKTILDILMVISYSFMEGYLGQDPGIALRDWALKRRRHP